LTLALPTGLEKTRSAHVERTAVDELRTAEWYGGDDRNAYLHRAWMRRGLPDDAFSGRPQIAIANTASDLTPCNAHLNEVAEAVKHGVYEAGGVPHNLPVVSLGETQVRPTAMLWRNLAAMAMEEMFRANPIDGLVLLGGCDKTIPALLMAAASVDIPAVVVPGGPMLNGTFRGELLGCGTDVWRLSEEVRAGTLPNGTFLTSESSMIRSRGHCNTMGTASTMAVMAEALGMTMPGVAGTPAPDSRLLAASHGSGRLAVEMVQEGRTPSTIMTAAAFRNPAGGDAGEVAVAIVHVVGLPDGTRPFRVHVDPSRDGSEVVSIVSDRIRSEFYHRIGIDELLPSNAGL
jgi:dihydroxyacid dehydratase/phosphogluconate dehydratase